MKVSNSLRFASVNYAKRDLSINTFRWCLSHFQSSLCCSGSQGGRSPSQQLSGRRFGTLQTFCLFITGPTWRHINHPTPHIQTPTHTYWAVKLFHFSIIWFNLVWWGSNIHYFTLLHFPLPTLPSVREWNQLFIIKACLKLRQHKHNFPCLFVYVTLIQRTLFSKWFTLE